MKKQKESLDEEEFEPKLASSMSEAASSVKRKSDKPQDEGLTAKLARTLQKQSMVASVQQEVAMAAAVNKPITYVSGAGAICLVKAKENPSSSTSDTKAKKLDGIVKIYAVPPAACPSYFRFKAVDALKESRVVLVSSLRQQLYSAEAFAARVLGKQIADQEWADSRMKAGVAVAYKPAIRSHLYIWVSNAWVAEFPAYAGVLKEAASQVEEWLAASSSSQLSSKFLRLTFGDFPVTVKHPRLSFAAVTEQEYLLTPEKDRGNLLSGRALIDKLSCTC